MTDELNSHLQGFFTDGLVTVVGLGHSAAHGLPTMPDLAGHLRAKMPSRLEPAQLAEWNLVENALDQGLSLEPALDNIAHDSPIIENIVAEAATCIAAAEARAIDLLTRPGIRYPMAELLPLVGRRPSVRILTTNYDRLIELAAEVAGFALDTGFVGANYGIYDPARSREDLKAGIQKRGRSYHIDYRKNVTLAKPHGSLDWYASAEAPIRSPYPLSLPRLMITPGQSKYRYGYEQPFDHHINLANEAIDGATAILAIGFGFNDPHLQTHLQPRIKQGLPTLILTRELTGSASALLLDCPNLTALERATATGGTRVHRGPIHYELPDTEIWQLGDFIREVLT
jgi:SIR2-like domain